ncbi:M56 family metallopeptidase [Adhaeribacter soli]|uniref:M48 family metalloprotease n=1 Tax=Adhaeribacter soli TaxID=2607655 RepID=A0A5N1J344_9BACT|nr:M56 family metallopeptidase [Adhaeribacter soli]KAA9340186.1 M48 family metalloprotease [Adhaeribacter soli]
MNYVQTFLSQEVVQALGWTILHSLWQGALVALALSVLLLFLNRQSAQVRYFISVTALFTTLALAVITFFSLYRSPAPETAKQATTAFSAGNATILVSKTETVWFENLFSTTFFSAYFEKHLPLLVTLWFMGLLVMALRMLGGLAYVQRIKNYQTKPLGDRWQNKLHALQQELGMKKPVKLLESLQVKVPMAIGYLKPVILVPVGAINGLSEKQVEAILAHELAHIYRHDYVFNLIQSLVETIFFYHPGMWWISATVRAERENCCDDIAITLCGDSLTFAGALAELEEMNYAAGPALAMALGGRKGSLLSRIKRLVSQPKRSASFTEGFLAACIVMVSLSMVSLSAMAKFGPEFEEFPAFIIGVPAKKAPVAASENTAKPEINMPKQAALKSAKTTPAETEPASKFASEDYVLSVSVAPDSSGKDIIIVKDKKGRIQELYVDGKKVRKRDMPEFQRIIEEREASNKKGLFAKGKKKKKEYASREDLEEARRVIQRAGTRPGRPNVYVYNYPSASDYRSHYKYKYDGLTAPPAPPAPLTPELPMRPMKPMKPMKPMRPMRPMKPMKPMAPMGDASKADLKAYEKELKEYEKEMAEYDAEVSAYEDRNSGEWKEFEHEMEEFNREMEQFGREMARYATAQVQMHMDSRNPEDEARVREEALARAAEVRARGAAERAREAEVRAKAAADRAKAAELRAKERAKDAEERAKEAKERAKEAKERSSRMEKLKAELKKDNLIGANTKSFTYKISKEGLYVNGKKQPEALFEKYGKMFHQKFDPKNKNSNYNEVYNVSED